MATFTKKIKVKEEVKLVVKKKKEKDPPPKTLEELAGNKSIVVNSDACGGGKIRFTKPTRFDEKVVCMKHATYFDVPYWSLRHYQYNTACDVWVLVEKENGGEFIRAELRVRAKDAKEGRVNAKQIIERLAEMCKALRDAEREREKEK